MPPDEDESQPVVTSVLRSLRLLECFQPGEPELALAQLVRRGGYSKTTTYRLLTTLVRAGWLERTNGAFRLTWRPFQIGGILLDSANVRREAPPVMRRLAEDAQFAVYLTVADGLRAVCIERIDRGQGLRVMDLVVGGSQPLHLGAGPRVLLAYHEGDLLPALLRQGLEMRTPHSITTAEALRADLAETRRRGYSISDSDATLGVSAVGAPVFDVSGAAVAAISVGGLAEPVALARDRLVELLVDAAGTISRRLGSNAGAAPRPAPTATDRREVGEVAL